PPLEEAEGGFLNLLLVPSGVVRAVLFDLDGTLINRLPTLLAYLPKQFLSYAPPARHDETVSYVRRFLELDADGYGNKESLYETLTSEFGLQAGVDELLQDFRSNAFDEVFLFPDALDVLTELRRLGYVLGIVSNGSAQSQRKKISVADLARHVEVVLISGVVGLRKPDSAIFHRAAGELSVMPEACLFVGDDPERDILGAAAAGMRTAWLTHGRSWPVALRPEPSLALRTLGELLQASF
ncbi:MAG TPA: HAD family hydrolase, partial [Trueperaceae bacterium]|nr:HAD family hydrolase [Trueperaceae bacterium]